MKTQCHNPYLPLWEHIPDGEPHVFEDRLYVFGSHDLENGNEFCEQYHGRHRWMISLTGVMKA